MAEKKAEIAQLIDLNDPANYVNRELSLLEFQRRVFEEVQDESNPLLERIKFLSILGSNLEEFFMVRVGGLIMQKEAGITELSPDGMTPAEQLAAIRSDALKLMTAARQYLINVLEPRLDEVGIHLMSYKDLDNKQRETVDDYFHETVFPVLTPLAVDPGHPFPHISNLSLNLAVRIKDQNGCKHFARVKVPATLPQWVPIKRSSGSVRRDGTVPHHHYFVWLSQLIKANLHTLFPGMEVVESHRFHVTRNADFDIQELEASDLLESMEENVRKRRFGSVVRLLVSKYMPKDIKDILAENMRVDSNDIYELDGPLCLRNLMELTKIDRHDLKDRSFVPIMLPQFKSKADGREISVFAAIRNGDLMLHHPYDSFDPVINFLRTAAQDANVLAIKQTLYRVGDNSPIVKALLEARRDYGKQVATLIELKARFDEKSNIGWARMLEQEGVHVTYGLLGLKTHSKIALVVRQEEGHIRRYVHLGTGNYNHITAHIYEDIGMLTCDDDIGADATDLFNYLTGYSNIDKFRKLLVAPINMRPRIEELIQQEINNHSDKKPGHIIIKINALVDRAMIRLLYQASQAGVKVDLLVRGICCLRPGVPGLSDNIRVISILGRFLEHSRIYYFYNKGKEVVYMGSADLMPRNLDRRVEVLYPVESERLIRHVRDNILETYLRDNVKARMMNADGSYFRIKSKSDEDPLINSQEEFITRAYQYAYEV